MSSLNWYICLFGYAARHLPLPSRATPKSEKSLSPSSPMMSISIDDDNNDDDDDAASLKKKRQRSTRTRSKTVNRTVLAITLFPTCLRDFMNSGEDEVISTAINRAIKDLRSIDGQFFLINDTPERFNIINIVGPVDDITKARNIAEEIVKSRGERPRTSAAHTCAVKESLGFAVDWTRFFAVESVENDVTILSTRFGGPTRYKITKRQRSD